MNNTRNDVSPRRKRGARLIMKNTIENVVTFGKDRFKIQGPRKLRNGKRNPKVNRSLVNINNRPVRPSGNFNMAKPKSDGFGTGNKGPGGIPRAGGVKRPCLTSR